MKPSRLLPFLCLGAAACLHAGPVDDAIVAIMQLSDHTNYSWTSTVTDDARTYEIDGKTVREGYTHVRMPVINTVRRKLGRDIADNRIEMIFRGNTACVLRTEEGWFRPDELHAPPPVADLAGGPGSSRSIIPGPIAGPGRPSRRGKMAVHASDDPRRYSNLQLAISPPHEELAVIVGSHVELQVDGDVATGRLSDTGARLLLVRDGQHRIEPVQATGSFKIWIRDRAVARYQLDLQGTLRVATGANASVVAVQQRSTTLVHDVGRISFLLSDIARVKLDRP